MEGGGVGGGGLPRHVLRGSLRVRRRSADELQAVVARQGAKVILLNVCETHRVTRQRHGSVADPASCGSLASFSS